MEKNVVDNKAESPYNEGKRKRKMKLVVAKSDAFEEVRCKYCGALLFKSLKKSGTSGTVEIKCRRCGKINVV